MVPQTNDKYIVPRRVFLAGSCRRGPLSLIENAVPLVALAYLAAHIIAWGIFTFQDRSAVGRISCGFNSRPVQTICRGAALTPQKTQTPESRPGTKLAQKQEVVAMWPSRSSSGRRDVIKGGASPIRCKNAARFKEYYVSIF